MKGRRRAAALLLGGLAAVGLVLWLTTFFGPPPRVAAPPIRDLAPQARTGEDFARLSCVHLRLANQAVESDGPADVVRKELASARALAAEALDRDPAFSALSGGIAALDEAVRRDDGAAAAVGLRVARRQCEALGG